MYRLWVTTNEKFKYHILQILKVDIFVTTEAIYLKQDTDEHEADMALK